MDENKIDIVFWRVGLRETYGMGLISNEEFLTMYEREFMYKDFLSPRETSVITHITNLISDTDSFAGHIESENKFIFDAELPKDKAAFKKHWIYYLAECLEESHIDSEDFDTLLNGIDFSNSVWSKEEELKVNTILDILRVEMISKVPSAIDFLKNPSFEVLMFANNMSESND